MGTTKNGKKEFSTHSLMPQTVLASRTHVRPSGALLRHGYAERRVFII